MCGRFASKEAKEKLAKLYQAKKVTHFDYSGSYNVAPTELAPIIIEGEDQERSLEIANFGIPMKKEGKEYPLLNAQSESYNKWSHILTRRCIIPANGFYEWAKVSDKNKQPFYFSPKEESMFSFAGLWRPVPRGFAFTILTTSANELVKPIHARMPVILGHNAIPAWLAFNSNNTLLSSLMEPYPANLMQAWEVNKLVNSPVNKGAECVAPLHQKM